MLATVTRSPLEGVVDVDPPFEEPPLPPVLDDPIMISKALDYYGKDLVELNKTKKASTFKDYRLIGANARPHIERVLQAGYINGYSDGSYRSTNDASRAEMSRVLYDFLQSIEFIN
jgi:hypothetical protein